MTPGGHRTQRLSSTARRVTPLPGGWKKIRAAVLARCGHRCEWLDPSGRCTAPATEVDHIGDPDDHSLDNLRGLCTRHHASKTGRDANALRWARTRPTRQPMRHPGLTG